jgi:hypothetical protein
MYCTDDKHTMLTGYRFIDDKHTVLTVGLSITKFIIFREKIPNRVRAIIW